MKLVSKAMGILVVLGIVGFVSQWVDAAGVEGKVYEYRTIPTEDVSGTYFGFGEFEPGAYFLVTIEEDTTPGDPDDNSPSCTPPTGQPFDGSWRQRRFRRRSFFRSEFDAEYMGTTYEFNVFGRMTGQGQLAGISTFLEDGQNKLVRWQSSETNACDLSAPTP